MTREEAIHYLERIKQEYDCSYEEDALDMAIKALEQQSMPTLVLPNIDKESYERLLKHPVMIHIMDEEQEQLDFVQPHKRIPVRLSVSENPNNCDLISREKVCDYIAEFINHEYSTDAECEMVDLMIKGIQHMPTVKPQPCEDAVSREAVEDKLFKLCNELEGIFANIRMQNQDESACGLCEYDCPSPYECPGFDIEDCFKLAYEIRHKWQSTKDLPSVKPQEITDENLHREREQAYMQGYEDASKRFRQELLKGDKKDV